MVGPARYVPCPSPTGDGAGYVGAAAPFRCQSAVIDPLGNIVVLRQGRSDAGPSAFRWSTTTSNQAPDDQRFGVVTAYCKVPSSANPENKCPDWVNDTLP